MPKKEIFIPPGIDQFSASPEAVEVYSRAFSEARRILAHPVMGPHVRKSADRLSQAYAASRAEQILAQEASIKNMAQRILDVGRQIILEKGWASQPEGENFAGQLFGSSHNAATLKLAAQTGRLMTMFERKQRGRTWRKGTVTLAIFRDLPDLRMIESNKTLSQLMFDFSIDYMTLLGFLLQGEDIYTSERVEVIEREKSRMLSFKLNHPERPFQANFYTDNNAKLQPGRHTDVFYVSFIPGRKAQPQD